jgi:ParB-like chromosome segregation protein Spo0J
MTIEKVKIEDIKKNPNNPRTIKDENFKKLVKSIQEFPQMLEIRPIVVDDNMIVLGGNMRLKACKEAGLKQIPIIKASELTDEQKSEFIIKDNVGYGEWDWGMIATEWDSDLLKDWGLEVVGFDIDSDEYGEGFSLPDGDKKPIQQITFTLADDQAEYIKNCIDEIKKTDDFKYIDKMGNENSNGNALYTILKLWGEQRK